MFHLMSLILFIVFALINEISADTCGYGTSTYYCSAGQSCGDYYGDCQGIPTYALVGIICTGIMLLLICIRCCIQVNSVNRRPIPRRGVVATQHPGLVRVQVYSYGNNLATRLPNAAPVVHHIREDAPPSYAVATSANPELPKF